MASFDSWQHTLTYGMTWQVTPGSLQANSCTEEQQYRHCTNSKESGWAVEPRGPNDQRLKSPRGRGWRADGLAEAKNGKPALVWQ